MLISIFKPCEFEVNPDLLYCKTLIDIIDLYEIKNKILTNFIYSRNKISSEHKISKIDVMNHNLDDLTAYILFDTKNYSLSKDYFNLLKEYEYPTLFSKESKLLGVRRAGQ